MKEYRIPTMQPIGDGAEKLYTLEHRRNEVIKEAAKEQGRILGFSPDEFWTCSLPEQLASTLSSFDRHAGKAAAIGYLKAEHKIDIQEDIRRLVIACQTLSSELIVSQCETCKGSGNWPHSMGQEACHNCNGEGRLLTKAVDVYAIDAFKAALEKLENILPV